MKQDLNLKIQKVGQKAKHPKKKNKKIPTHPMTMPQAAGKNSIFLLEYNALQSCRPWAASIKFCKQKAGAKYYIYYKPLMGFHKCDKGRIPFPLLGTLRRQRGQSIHQEQWYHHICRASASSTRSFGIPRAPRHGGSNSLVASITPQTGTCRIHLEKRKTTWAEHVSAKSGKFYMLQLIM